jgi:hypothetical protein
VFGTVGLCVVVVLLRIRHKSGREVATAQAAYPSTTEEILTSSDMNVEAGKSSLDADHSKPFAHLPGPTLSQSSAQQVGGPKCTPLPSAQSCGGSSASGAVSGIGEGASTLPAAGLGDLQGHFESGEDLSSTPRGLATETATEATPPLVSATSDSTNALLTRI